MRDRKGEKSMKKRTKKLLAIGMAAIMTAGLAVGCGKKATPENLLTDMGKIWRGLNPQL